MKYLLVDDSAADRQSILGLLQAAMGAVCAGEITSREAFEAALRQQDYQWILTEAQLAWGTGLEVLRAAQNQTPPPPVIMVTKPADLESAVQAMKAGLSDYVAKSHLERLPLAVEAAVAQAKYRRDYQAIVEQLQESEARYRAVSELGSDFAYACRVEPGGRVRLEWVTESLERALNATSREICARDNWIDLVHVEDRPMAARFFREALSGQPGSAEFRLVLESGETRWLRHLARPIWDEAQARVVRIYGAIQDITQHQRSEERFRQTTSELQAIISALPDLYFRLDTDGTILDYHALRSKDLFVPPEAFLGRRMQSVLPADVGLQIFQGILNVRKTGLLTRVEYELPLRDGLQRFEARLLPLREKQLIAIVRDITEPKRAEQALLRRERQLETLARASQEVNKVLEMPVILRTVVSAAMDLVDATAGAAGLWFDGQMVYTELNWQGRWAAVDFRLNLQTSLIGHVMQTRQGYFTNQAGEDPLVATELKKTWPVDNLACVPVLAGVDQLLGCLEVYNTVGRRPYDAHDLAMLQGLAASAAIAMKNANMLVAQRQAEETLRQSEERFRLLFETAPLGILATRSHQILYANPACIRMFGYDDPAAFRDIPFGHLLAPEQRSEVEQWREAIKQGPVDSPPRECTGRRADGASFPFLLDFTRMELSDGTAVVAFMVDLSERSQLESQLRQAQKMEFIGQLSSGLVHDFNNILTILQGHVDLLLAEPGQSADMAVSLQEMAAATGRATRLTEQILAFCQKQTLRLVRLDLNALIRRLTGIIGHLLGETIHLELTCAPDLPDILADPGMMEQVLINLLVNARDAMPKGGRIHITTAHRELPVVPPGAPPGSLPGSYVDMRIIDTGCGMDEPTLRHLFEPFFSTKAPGEGTGLGLATVYGIIKQHHGWLKVESQPGQGSVFEIILPAHSELAPPPAPPIQPSAGAILLVEDEEQVRSVMRNILRRRGYPVLEAASGIDALRVWASRRDQIGLLLTDIVMPEGLSGTELARQLRAQKPELKILYTSGYLNEIEALNPSENSDVHLLIKPFHAPDLIRKVEEVFGQAPAPPDP